MKEQGTIIFEEVVPDICDTITLIRFKKAAN